jgi:hypothetical protein
VQTPAQTKLAADGISLPCVARSEEDSVSVTVVVPSAPVGAAAPVTLAPETGLRFPFSS